MAKLFYSSKEAAQKLGISESDVKNLVRDGKIREFRDGGGAAYKVDDVEALAGKGGARSAPAKDESSIELAPMDDSGLALSPAGEDDDNISLRMSDDTSIGMKSPNKDKHDSVVGSVGISVFDDDELEKGVDPLAQTQISDLSGLAAEGTGSGILDLSRERDDTSLGSELLDEIYEDGGGMEMGDATRAGLDAAIPDAPVSSSTGDIFGGSSKKATSGKASGGKARNDVFAAAADEAAPTLPPPGPRVVPTSSADAANAAMTSLLFVSLLVMIFASVVVAAMVQGVMPSFVVSVNNSLLIFAGGAAGVAAIASLLSYVVARRS